MVTAKIAHLYRTHAHAHAQHAPQSTTSNSTATTIKNNTATATTTTITNNRKFMRTLSFVQKEGVHAQQKRVRGHHASVRVSATEILVWRQRAPRI